MANTDVRQKLAQRPSPLEYERSQRKTMLDYFDKQYENVDVHGPSRVLKRLKNVLRSSENE